MKAICLTTLLAILLASSSVFAQMGGQQHDHSTHGMESGQQKSGDDKARCAYDGMPMKKSAMVPMKHGDETLYFCNEEQKAAFQKSPKRYLKKVAIGDLHALMNVLTMKEYMGMMKSMGMGGMMKAGNPNNTHWLSVYLAAGQPVELSGITIKVVAPDGKASYKELKYDKMMKSHAAQFSFLESGKYKLHTLLELPGIEMP
jgi:YHS domain-containing protein